MKDSIRFKLMLLLTIACLANLAAPSKEGNRLAGTIRAGALLGAAAVCCFSSRCRE